MTLVGHPADGKRQIIIELGCFTLPYCGQCSWHVEKHELGHGANARLIRSGLQHMPAESIEKSFITIPPYIHVFGFYFSAAVHSIKVANNSQPYLVAGCTTDTSEPLKSKTKQFYQEKFMELVQFVHLWWLIWTLTGGVVSLSSSFFKSEQRALTAANNIPLTASRNVEFKSSPRSRPCQSKPRRYRWGTQTGSSF